MTYTDTSEGPHIPAPEGPHEPTATPAPSGPGLLLRLSDHARRRRRLTTGGWLAALVAVIAVSGAAAGDFDADYTAEDSGSRAARDLFEDRFPDAAGETVNLVVRSTTDLDAPEVRTTVDALVADLSDLPHVAAVGDPLDPAARAPDGRTALTQVRLDVDRPSAMPVEDTQALMDAVDAADTDAVAFAVNGQVVADVQNGSGGPEIIGLAAALVILLLTFGSVIAAGLPVLVAVAGLAISSSLIGLLALVLSVPPWAPALAAMLGIGVGIDYVLLVVTRYRENLHTGLPPAAAVTATMDTAGRSVLIAGTTVMVSLVGLVMTGLPYLQGAAVAAMLAILVVMAASVTLLPALLGFVGPRIDRLRLSRRRSRTGSLQHASASTSAAASGRDDATRWVRWARFVQRHSLLATVTGVVVLLLLALPVVSVRFGLPDAGNDPVDTTSRTAYDWTADAYGVGANGPLVLAVDLPAADVSGTASTSLLDRLPAALAGTPGVAGVTPVQLNEAQDAAVVTVTPDASPQSERTAQLVERLRDDVLPDLTAGTGATVYVGGATAAALDSTPTSPHDCL